MDSLGLPKVLAGAPSQRNASLMLVFKFTRGIARRFYGGLHQKLVITVQEDS